MATVTMVFSQLKWIPTCTYLDKTDTIISPRPLKFSISEYEQKKSHLFNKPGGFWMVLDERHRTGSAAGAATLFHCEFNCRALLTIRLRVSHLHALLLFLPVTGETTDMSSGLLMNDSD